MTTDFALASEGATAYTYGGYWGSGPPSNINDGDDATGCDLDSPRRVMIDLGQARTISSARSKQGYFGDATGYADISFSATGVDPDWTFLERRNFASNDDTWDLSAPTSARYWKFEPNAALWWGVFTLSLFGDDAPPPSAGFVQVVIV